MFFSLYHWIAGRAPPFHFFVLFVSPSVNGLGWKAVKKQCSRSFEIQYVYACDQVKAGNFGVRHHHGAKILADYPSKHSHSPHHRHMFLLYLHEQNSLWYPLWGMIPGNLWGWVGNKVDAYARNTHYSQRQISGDACNTCITRGLMI